MDLTLTPELAAFREEVRAFLAAHKSEYAAGAPKDPKAWQRLLIDNGYAARTIPAPTAVSARSRTASRPGSSPRPSSKPARRGA